MTPQRPAPKKRHVAAELHINAAARPPTALYHCYRCGHHADARGPEAVAAFAAAIRADHRATCPANTKENSTR